MAATGNLRLSTDPEDGQVRAAGEIDSHSSEDLDVALGGFAADARITLDLEGVTFIDSSGLRVIVTAHRRLSEGGGGLTLRSPSDAVARLLEITGLADELEIDPGRA